MLLKKLYIPIGVSLVLLLAMGFLALRSDVPDAPVKIYKVTQPAERSETQTDTANSETSQGGDFHADGTFHTEPHEPVTTEETPVSTSEVPMSYLLSEFPDYETMNSVSQGVARELARLRWEGENRRAKKAKILAELRAGNAELKRKVAEQEAEKELLSYIESTVDYLHTEYPDLYAFRDKYSDPQPEDFIREYPDETERSTFFARALEAGKIRREMADRILATPSLYEKLSSRHQDILHNFPSIDEISESLEILQSKGVLN